MARSACYTVRRNWRVQPLTLALSPAIKGVARNWWRYFKLRNQANWQQIQQALERARAAYVGADEFETEVSVSLCLENLEGLDQIHGRGSASHAAGLMARALEVETGPQDFVARTGEASFALVMVGCGRAEAEELIARIQVRFDEYLYDAGYECELSFTEAQVEAADRPTSLLPSALRSLAFYGSERLHLN